MAVLARLVGLFSLLILVLGCCYPASIFHSRTSGLDEPGLTFMVGVMSTLSQIAGHVANQITGVPPIVAYRNMLARVIPRIHQKHPEVETEDVIFQGVPARVYKPKSTKGLSPCLIFLHGGGWCTLSPEMYDGTSIQLALKSNTTVISVDYRLAPEHPYPAGFEDSVKVTKYILQHGADHGIDVTRVAIVGDSAGGTLASAVALRLAREGSRDFPSLKLHVLLYPVTQVVNFRTSSYLLYKHDLILSQRLMAIFTASYLGQNSSERVLTAIEENRHISPYARRTIYRQHFRSDSIPNYVQKNSSPEPWNDDDEEKRDESVKMDGLVVDPYVSPLLAKDLSKLPPAYVVVAEVDVLRDDALLYVHRLRQVGVAVELSFVKGHAHGFLMRAPIAAFQFKRAEQELDKLSVYLKQML